MATNFYPCADEISLAKLILGYGDEIALEKVLRRKQKIFNTNFHQRAYISHLPVQTYADDMSSVYNQSKVGKPYVVSTWVVVPTIPIVSKLRVSRYNVDFL